MPDQLSTKFVAFTEPSPVARSYPNVAPNAGAKTELETDITP
jgi:hypothetical protein